METLFEKAAIRIGIDTIKIKLSRNLYQSDPIEQLVENLKNALDPDEIFFVQKDGYHHLKNKDSKHYIATIYKTGTDSGMIEIFGICQTITEFKLTDHHATILSVVGNLTDNIEMTLQKMDVSLDFFYPHDRSFVFESTKALALNFVDSLNDQIKFPFVHLTEIPMITIRVPKSQKRVIKFALDHKNIKSPEDKKKKGDCYCRWVKITSQHLYLNRVNYGECEKDESSHFEIKINDRKIYNRILNLFDGTPTFSSDYDHETDIYIKLGAKKVSIIKYDKSKRDKDKKRDVQGVYNATIKEIADTDDEHDDLMEHFKHTRVELQFFKPCVTPTQTKLLNINSESSYGQLLDCIKKEIKKMTIFILKPDISTNDYLDLYKKRLNQSNGTKRTRLIEQLTSSGRILEVTPDAWNDFENQIDVLKSKFIPSNNPIRSIIHRVGGRS